MISKTSSRNSMARTSPSPILMNDSSNKPRPSFPTMMKKLSMKMLSWTCQLEPWKKPTIQCACTCARWVSFRSSLAKAK
jgi:hypothetical protein